MVAPFEGYIKAKDRTRLFYRFWISPRERSVLLYVHGMESHSGWFTETAEFLCEQGFSVYAFDRRGAGLSGGVRGHLASYLQLFQDLKAQMRFVGSRHPKRPLFLIGSCFGAKVVAGAMTEAEEGEWEMPRFSGMILLCPSVGVRVHIGLWSKVKIIYSVLTGGLNLFPIPLLTKHFTSNPHFFDYIERDQVRIRQATASFLINVLRLRRSLRRAATRLTKPLLVLQAADDAVVDIKKVRNWFQKVSAEDKTMIILPDSQHTLDFDRDKEVYWGHLKNWLSQQLNPSNSIGE